MLSEPENDRSDGNLGHVVGGAFGIPSGQITKLFEPVETPFHHIALLVPVIINCWWTSTGRALGFPSADLVRLFGAGKRDTPFAHLFPGGRMRICLIREHFVRPSSWPSRPVTLDTDLIQQREKLRIVPGLSAGQGHAHRQAAAVHGEVDFAT